MAAESLVLCFSDFSPHHTCDFVTCSAFIVSQHKTHTFGSWNCGCDLGEHFVNFVDPIGS